ncbi:MAG TPA: hypothetical protein VJS64_00550 [Pyrinomonadaceae bacterium]|nr:hypothetical protein [Pyrinomonadaceae bacterium]
MTNRVLAIAIAVSLVAAIASMPVQVCAQNQEAVKIEKIRESIRKLGLGEDARVEIKLRDGRKLKGYIREANDDSFVVVEPKSGTAVSIPYSDVQQIKGRNRLTAAKVGLTIVKGVAIVAAVAGASLLLLLLVVPKT